MRRAIPRRRDGIVIPPGAAAWSKGLVRASVGLALILTARPWTAAASGETLSIEQAVSLAFEGNRQIKSAVLDVSKAQDELGSSRTNALPSFNIYALESKTLDDIQVRVPEGAFGDFPATGPIPAADSEVTTPAKTTGLILGQIAQPLTQPGRGIL